uniref:Uncharacterized protein n=1 Tax=Moniliophthora roreri TaxID=221103 RepID=A0A0W0F7W2_MONRR
MPIISLFMRDGIFWFLSVFVVMVPQAAITAGARVTIGEVMIKFVHSYSNFYGATN